MGAVLVYLTGSMLEKMEPQSRLQAVAISGGPAARMTMCICSNVQAAQLYGHVGKHPTRRVSVFWASETAWEEKMHTMVPGIGVPLRFRTTWPRWPAPPEK